MSEGNDSAERILKYSRSFRPYPATVPDLELQETEQERIRRVLGQMHEEPEDEDHGMEMLAGVMLTVILTLILGSIYLVGVVWK